MQTEPHSVPDADQHLWRLSSSRVMPLDRPRVLAILNLTPDSFSDGDSYPTVDHAVQAAKRALNDGADGLDIGGESTRPGAARVPADEQIRRVVPVIAAIRKSLGDEFGITIDTTLALVARAALDAGADAINDVSAGIEDADMLALAVERRCGIILMHRLRPPGADVYSHKHAAPPEYAAGGSSGGVVESVCDFLSERAVAALGAGIARESIMLDPGLGFGKSVEQNLELIRRTPELCELGYPILSGVSRKSFAAKVAGMNMESPARERVSATVALSVVHLLAGASVFRVHDVREHVEALRAAWGAFSARTNTPQRP